MKQPALVHNIVANRQPSIETREAHDLHSQHWPLGWYRVGSLFGQSVMFFLEPGERALRTCVSLIAVEIEVIRAGCRLDVWIVLDGINP